MRARGILVVVLLLVDLSVWAPILYVDHQFIKLREALCSSVTEVTKFDPTRDTLISSPYGAWLTGNGSSCALFEYTVKGKSVTREVKFYGYADGKWFRVRSWEEKAQ